MANKSSQIITQRIFRVLRLLTLLCAVYWPNQSLWAATPATVASIPPFYNLVAAVMEGVGTPKLLVNVGASPHDYSLRPSNIQTLIEADIIFWAGPALESFLANPLNSVDLKPGVKIVQFDKTPGLLLLPTRLGKYWEAHSHHHGDADDNGHEEGSAHEHEHEHEHNSNIDMHFWLDPDNGSVLIDSIVKNLSQIDSTHAAIYKNNGLKTKKALKALDKKLKIKLAKVKNIPFIVFHDGYQYFEHHYGLRGVGSITLHPEIPPSAQRLLSIREIIKNTHAHCVFTEPQFQPKLVDSIIQDTGVKTGELDPLGPLSKDHKNGYFELLENLANSLSNCLSE